MKASETMPSSAVSDQWASSAVRRSLRWFGILLKEFQHPLFGDTERKGSAKGRPTALREMERREMRGEQSRTVVVSFWFGSLCHYFSRQCK